MNMRALHIAAFLSLSALIFFALDFTARAGSDNELALHFDQHPAAAPYLCVVKGKPVKRVV
ncbi:hypothetical protein SFA35_08445 [Pseudomonas sp. HR96]|uniref:hypothetical protein n=1 Tax=Pseudomonas sp. HR96 TaxID=1027966 RepID=UPI002A74DBE7|nr:hypothetical protein [Pseudomonas sp. HR96]WPP01372.1 hypothetical protein SFA35_08445 [Pseudomonas sp. HR96]